MESIKNCFSQKDAYPINHLNSYQYGKLITFLRFMIIFLVLSLGSLSCFLGYLVFKQNKSDLVYFAMPSGTLAAQRQEEVDTIARATFEIENFTLRFVQDAFAHSEHNYRENIERALTVMSNDAAVVLKKQFSDDSLFKVYKEFNGVTTVSVDKLQTNVTSYPYAIQVHFTTHLKFLSGQDKLKTHTYQQGMHIAIESTRRCTKNPYGLLITDLKFIQYETH